MLFLKMLIKRLLLLEVLYQFCRIVYFLVNYKYFTPLTLPGAYQIFIGSLRFDASTIVYSNALYIAMFILPFNFRHNKTYQLIAKGIFLLSNGIFLLANLVDSAYFPFLLRRTNAAFFLEFKNDTNLLASSGKFIYSYWYISLLIILVLWVLYKSYVLIKMPNREDYTPKKNVLDAILLPFIVVIWLGLARGSFVPSNRPINNSYAGFYITKPNEVNLVINTPFSIMMTWGNIQLPEVHYFSSLQEAALYYQPVQCYHQTDSATGKNVVIIIVESLSREFVGSLNDTTNGYKGYTPFLDSLIGKSLVFNNAYANGRRSIEAIPSVVASIPSTNEAYTLTPYNGNQINSIVSLLKKRGYNSSFFHGAHAGSMGFAAFMKLAGVDNTYSKDEYGNDKDYDGTWGIWDEEFLQFCSNKMNGDKQPFVSVIFTVSSHHPFKIPERYNNTFDKGTLPIHPTIQYTDMALRKFFESASKMPWYNNTVFVITADHAAPYNYYNQYQNVMGYYAIPILFYTPDSTLIGNRNGLIQQSDIFPTLVDYLGINDTIVAFGSSVLNNNENHLLVNDYGGMYQAMYNNLLLQYDGNKVLGVYKFKEDAKLEHNIMGQNPVKEEEILLKLKAFLQQYSTRVRQNKMLP